MGVVCLYGCLLPRVASDGKEIGPAGPEDGSPQPRGEMLNGSEAEGKLREFDEKEDEHRQAEPVGAPPGERQGRQAFTALTSG